MKKLLFIILSLLIVSCSSDKKENISNEPTIEGKWLVYNNVTFNQMIELEDGKIKEYGCPNLPDGECDISFWLSFDGNFFSDCQTYLFENNVYKRTNCVGTKIEQYPTFECDGNVIKWQGNFFNWVRLEGNTANCEY